MKICNNKRILAMLLIISLFISVAVTAAEQTVFVPECSRQEKVLIALGLMEGLADSDKSKTVTRGQAAHYLADFLGAPQGNGISQYNDVNASTKYVQDIVLLTDLGIANGNTEGKFEPERAITLQEFTKMLLSIIGYGLPSERSGGYPGGYLQYAYRLGILDGLKNQPVDKAFSLASLCIMLYNTLDVQILSVESIGANGITAEETDDNTVLTEMLHYNSGRGIVTANEKCGLTTAKGQTRGNVLINGKKFQCGLTNVDEYLGYQIDYYYNQEDDGSCILLYAEPSSKNSVLTLTGENIIRLNGLHLEYIDAGDIVRTARLTSSTDVVYNYRPVSPFKECDVLVKNGTVTLIDSDGDGAYNTVISKKYRTVYAKSIDYAGEIIFDEYNPMEPIRIGQTGQDISVHIYGRKGSEVTLDFLEQDSVLSCLLSRDGSYIEITEVVDEVIGIVKEVNTEEDKEYVTIDDTTYLLCDELQKYGITWTIGDKVICYLDLLGNIAMVKEEKISRYRWAYLDEIYVEQGLAGSMQIRVLTQESHKKLAVYTCGSKLVVDTEVYKTTEQQKNSLTGTVGKMIRFAVNADGQVSMVQTMDKGAFFELHGDTTTALAWSQSAYMFANKFGASSETLVFSVPDNKDINRYLCTGPLDVFLHDTGYAIKAYSLSQDRLSADVILYECKGNQGASLTNRSPVLMVDEVSKIIDTDGDEYMKVSGYQGSQYVSYLALSTELLENITALNDAEIGKQYTVKRGDLIQFALNADRYIDDAELICRASENLKVFSKTNPSNSNFYAIRRTVSGWIYQKDGLFFNMTTEDPAQAAADRLDVYKILDSSSIYLYDTSSGKVNAGTVSDLLAYKEVGSRCSQVAAITLRGNVAALVIAQ